MSAEFSIVNMIKLFVAFVYFLFDLFFICFLLQNINIQVIIINSQKINVSKSIMYYSINYLLLFFYRKNLLILQCIVVIGLI